MEIQRIFYSNRISLNFFMGIEFEISGNGTSNIWIIMVNLLTY